jgi:hypothetical protein
MYSTQDNLEITESGLSGFIRNKLFNPVFRELTGMSVSAAENALSGHLFGAERAAGAIFISLFYS